MLNELSLSSLPPHHHWKHTYPLMSQTDGEVVWRKDKACCLNTWVKHTASCVTKSRLGRLTDAYEQQEEKRVTGRHQCINHVILFISEEQGWPSNSHVLCNIWMAQKKKKCMEHAHLRDLGLLVIDANES